MCETDQSSTSSQGANTPERAASKKSRPQGQAARKKIVKRYLLRIFCICCWRIRWMKK